MGIKEILMIQVLLHETHSKLLDLVDKLTPETASLFVLKDYDNFLKDFSVIRKLKNLSRSLKTQPKNIIIVSSEINIPESLKEFVTLLEFPLT